MLTLISTTVSVKMFHVLCAQVFDFAGSFNKVCLLLIFLVTKYHCDRFKYTLPMYFVN